jgi:hypothetical protein
MQKDDGPSFEGYCPAAFTWTPTASSAAVGSSSASLHQVLGAALRRPPRTMSWLTGRTCERTNFLVDWQTWFCSFDLERSKCYPLRKVCAHINERSTFNFLAWIVL